jgi:hypothetical protein
MRFLASIVVAMAALLLSPLTHAQNADSIADATAAANRWLAVSDQGNPGASWDQAAHAFQAGVSKAAWTGSVNALNAQLGPAKSRQLKSAVYTKELPGAPDGEYVVIQYQTQFEHKAHAVETVTPMREPDGSWKVSGYFVK